MIILWLGIFFFSEEIAIMFNVEQALVFVICIRVIIAIMSVYILSSYWSLLTGWSEEVDFKNVKNLIAAIIISNVAARVFSVMYNVDFYNMFQIILFGMCITTKFSDFDLYKYDEEN